MDRSIDNVEHLIGIVAREWCPPEQGTDRERQAWRNGFREAFDIVADEVSDGMYDNGRTMGILDRLDHDLAHIRANARRGG